MKCLLCIVIVLFTIPSVVFCQEVIFFYDFNNEKVGKPPSDPWKLTPAGEVEIADVPDAINKSVRITDSGSGAGMTLFLDKPITGKTVSLEFRFMREKKWTLACEIFYAMNRKCPDDWSGICIKDSDNGKISYHDGAGWIDTVLIDDEVWHDVKLIFYLDKDRYDFHYDGKEMANNIGYRNWAGLSKQGIDKFNAANVGDGGSTFVKYYDDIMLYEGTKRPFAVESKNKLSTVWGKVKLSVLKDPYMEYPNGHKGTRFERGLLLSAYSKSDWLSR